MRCLHIKFSGHLHRLRVSSASTRIPSTDLCDEHIDTLVRREVHFIGLNQFANSSVSVVPPHHCLCTKNTDVERS